MTKSKEYEQSISIKKKATKEDCERLNLYNLGIKEGDEFIELPEPKNKDELFEQFKNIYAQRICESLQRCFKKKYGKPTKKIIKDELAEINYFIEKANKLSTVKTFENELVAASEDSLHEYSRLKNYFYKKDSKPFNPSVHIYYNSNAALVYGKYFLFKNWLEHELEKTSSNQKEKKQEPEQEEETFKFENNFDNVDYKEVYNHFKTGLLKTKKLEEGELQNFLIAAFQNKIVPKNKFKLKNIESKDKVMKVFYQYYKDVAAKPYGKQKGYAGLLGNYFQGYKTSTVSSNFSKTVY